MNYSSEYFENYLMFFQNHGSLKKAKVSRRKDTCFSLFLKKSQSIRESSAYFSSWKNTGKISQAIIHKYWKEKLWLSEEQTASKRLISSLDEVILTMLTGRSSKCHVSWFS